jgi:hypothetical protein
VARSMEPGRHCHHLNAWRGSSDTPPPPPLPSVETLAQLAGLERAPCLGDTFLSQAGRGRSVCVEYTERARLGGLPKDTRLVVKEVGVAHIAADPERGQPAQWGLCIRCDSQLCPGEDCWVNITQEDGAAIAWPAPARGRGHCASRSHDQRPLAAVVTVGQRSRTLAAVVTAGRPTL